MPAVVQAYRRSARRILERPSGGDVGRPEPRGQRRDAVASTVARRCPGSSARLHGDDESQSSGVTVAVSGQKAHGIGACGRRSSGELARLRVEGQARHAGQEAIRQRAVAPARGRQCERSDSHSRDVALVRYRGRAETRLWVCDGRRPRDRVPAPVASPRSDADRNLRDGPVLSGLARLERT